MGIEADDIALNKAAIVERCIRRIHAEYAANPSLDDLTHLDALILNVERACQACIDLAMHLVASRRLGIPQSSGDAFHLLARAEVIGPDVEQAMRAMTGFRNIAIHQYQTMNVEILRRIATAAWKDWERFFSALGISIMTEAPSRNRAARGTSTRTRHGGKT